MANPRSIARIEARIRERVAYCVEFELKDPRASFITVTRVEVSSDLSIAKVYYTVLGTDGDKSKVAHMLEGASSFVRHQIGRVLETRKIPQVHWFFDDTIEIQENMEEAIFEALARDRKINPSAHAEAPIEAPPREEAVRDDPNEREKEDR